MADARYKQVRDLAVAAGLTVLVVANVTPILWGFLSSLKAHDEIMTLAPKLFSFSATLGNYRQVVESGFLIGMRNSTLYALASVLVGLAAGSLAAYGFDRFQFRGRSTLFLIVVASIPLAIGAAALLIPNYLFFAKLGFIDRWYTLPLIYSVHGLPIAIWIIKGSIETVPRGLDEAASIDGASSLTVLCQSFYLSASRRSARPDCSSSSTRGTSSSPGPSWSTPRS